MKAKWYICDSCKEAYPKEEISYLRIQLVRYESGAIFQIVNVGGRICDKCADNWKAVVSS